MKKSSTFVPTLIAKTLSLPADGSLALGPEIVLHTHDGFYTKGSALLGEESVIDKFVESAGLSTCGSGATEECFYTIASRAPTDADIQITHQKDDETDKKPALEKHAGVMFAARDGLTRFAGQTGLKFVLHLMRKPVCNPFAEGTKDTLHIIVGASPPGAVTKAEKQSLCGVRLHHKGYWLRLNGPTKGQGYIFNEEEEPKDEAGQIVGRNIYLFAPAVSREAGALLSLEGGDLLRKLLQLVSKVLTEETKPVVETALQSPESFRDYANDRLEKEFGYIQELADQTDRKLARALEDYHQALGDKRHYLGVGGYIQKLLESIVENQVPVDWERLNKHPLVKELSVVDEALHVKTKRIIVEEEEVRYDLGEFIIRLQLGAQVAVWAAAPTHPRGIPHPHISEENSLCFGNAGIEITTAASELRFADAIELVIAWLSNGYDSKLADVKIEEWPRYEEVRDART